MPVKPSEQEDEYFAKQEIHRRILEQNKLAQAVAVDEQKRRKELHYMHCPKCGADLLEETLEGVAVDICPGCHGVWLDDGELAKLTEEGKGVVKFLRGVFK